MLVIEDVLDELNGDKVFSKLDIMRGKNQIKVRETNIPKLHSELVLVIVSILWCLLVQLMLQPLSNH